MKVPPLVYHRPESVDEALQLLHRYEGDAKPLAGGQSLIPLLALRLSRPQALVDLNDLPQLALKYFDSSHFIIGAMTRHRAIELDARIAHRCAAIADVAPLIGHTAIRNRGTVGGSIAHGDAAAEWPALCLLLEGVLTLQSTRGSREVAADQFFQGFLSTAIEDDELLTSLRLTMPGPRTGTAFQELARRYGDYAIVGVGASLTLDNGGQISAARLVLTGVGPAPHRAHAAEAILVGENADGIPFDEAAEAVASSITPPPDLNGDTRYRQDLSRVLTRRVLTIARDRARTNMESE